jgi:hypothetical protein
VDGESGDEEEERGFEEESTSPAQGCDGFVDRGKVVRDWWGVNKWEEDLASVFDSELSGSFLSTRQGSGDPANTCIELEISYKL